MKLYILALGVFVLVAIGLMLYTQLDRINDHMTNIEHATMQLEERTRILDKAQGSVERFLDKLLPPDNPNQ